jgi:hypothetical protein
VIFVTSRGFTAYDQNSDMSTRNVPGGKGRPAREADSLNAICETMWEPRCLKP